MTPIFRAPRAPRSWLCGPRTLSRETRVVLRGDIGRSIDIRPWRSSPITAHAAPAEIVAAAVLWLARTMGEAVVVVAAGDAGVGERVLSLQPLARRPVFAVDTLAPATAGAFVAAVEAGRTKALDSGAWLADAVARDPELRAPTVHGRSAPRSSSTPVSLACATLPRRSTSASAGWARRSSATPTRSINRTPIDMRHRS
jgi:hypothetical protein